MPPSSSPLRRRASRSPSEWGRGHSVDEGKPWDDRPRLRKGLPHKGDGGKGEAEGKGKGTGKGKGKGKRKDGSSPSLSGVKGDAPRATSEQVGSYIHELVVVVLMWCS